MKNFVVAYLSFFDNVIVQKVVKGHDELEAVKTWMGDYGFDFTDYVDRNMKEIEEFFCNCDSTISIIEV